MISNRIGQIAIPAAIVGIVVMMVVPLPTPLIDLLLVSNIALATLALLVSMSTRRVLEFSIFPSYLLIATLFRLALNVSVTRLVLLHGYAGQVIESFGHFVVGGSVIVGLVIFLILIVIQFIVITNGAGRVAEVAARFTLDAMPGKQMAIDADLNSGLINETEAKRRRKDIADEADFYGAMDGASKFVKGDAIAAIVIVLINLIGGFAIGILQRHMSFGDAVSKYSLLTVGDGLVAQIPALLISLSSGLIVTARRDRERSRYRPACTSSRGTSAHCGSPAARSASWQSCPGCRRSRSCWSVAGCSRSRRGCRRKRRSSPRPPVTRSELEPPPLSPDAPERIATDMRVEPLELEIAFDLVDLVDASKGGDLLDRVRALAPQARARARHRDPARADARQHGAAVEHLHDPRARRGGRPRRGTANHVLVLGDDQPGLPGTPTREPVFGLPARWVPLEFRHQAEVTGATVVDRASVITTHLAEVVRRNAGRLLGRQDVKLLIDLVKQTDPVVIDELNGANITAGEIQRVLQSLLDEGVGIRDLVRIFEVIVGAFPRHEGPRTDRRSGPHVARTGDIRGARARRTTARADARADHRTLIGRGVARERARNLPRVGPADRRAVGERGRAERAGGRDEGHRTGARVFHAVAGRADGVCCKPPRRGFPSSPTRSSERSSSSTRSRW